MYHSVSDLLIPILTGIFGAFLGFAISRLNDWLSERRTLRRAVHHLTTEIRNVRRHFEHARDKIKGHSSMEPWRKIIHLETSRFYGNALGSFDVGLLRLLDEETAGHVMYLILMLRNNNAYIDQAKTQAVDGEAQVCAAICDEFVERCTLTIDMANKVNGDIRSHYRRHTRKTAKSPAA